MASLFPRGSDIHLLYLDLPAWKLPKRFSLRQDRCHPHQWKDAHGGWAKRYRRGGEKEEDERREEDELEVLYHVCDFLTSTDHVQVLSAVNAVNSVTVLVNITNI